MTTEVKLMLREAKVLKALLEAEEPVRASDLAAITGINELNTGKHLKKFEKVGLAELTDKRTNIWQIPEAVIN